MDVWDKMSDTISEKGKKVAHKAKNAAEIFNLKGQISTCEEVMKKNYLEIGRLFCEMYEKEEDAPFEKQRTAVKNAKAAVQELQEQINQRKGL